jgi:hypothetical protein
MIEKLKVSGAAVMWMMVSSNALAEEFIVDLNRPNTYAAIFESGLRPRHWIENDTSTVEVRPATSVGFKLLNWQLPPLKAGDSTYKCRGVKDEGSYPVLC